MPAPFRRVALIGKFHAPPGPATETARRALLAIRDFLLGRGLAVSLEAATAEALNAAGSPTLDFDAISGSCDVAVVVGGDGTMLGVGRRLGPQGVPMIGVNQGRLGFITDIPLADYESVLPPMLEGSFVAEDRALIQACVRRGANTVFDALALNDVVVNRGATAGMVELRVEVDGHFVANQRADGLIIATPTGSTAYALSAGGPLLHPSIPGWVLVPIAPHTLSNRPVVLADASEIAIEIVAGRDMSANFDMQSLASLQIGDRVVVQRSRHTARFLHPVGWNYFDTLRKKMHWNEGGS
jgi:NAD+ kinase